MDMLTFVMAHGTGLAFKWNNLCAAEMDTTENVDHKSEALVTKPDHLKIQMIISKNLKCKT